MLAATFVVGLLPSLLGASLQWRALAKLRVNLSGRAEIDLVPAV